MKFNFGKNWQNFLDNKLDGERINIAEKSLREFTIKKAKKNQSFFDADLDLDCLVLQQKNLVLRFFQLMETKSS